MRTPTAKDLWRERCAAVRRARSADDLESARQHNLDHLLAEFGGTGTVCVFSPLPREPLAADTPERLAATGTRVLVPITDRDRPLDWVALPTQWEPGPFGIRTPVGPRLGTNAIRDVDAVVVPAWVVDRRGYRLGRGGGYYDRTLALLDDPGRVSAVLFDDELVDVIPADSHDRQVSRVVRPSSGFVRL